MKLATYVLMQLAGSRRWAAWHSNEGDEEEEVTKLPQCAAETTTRLLREVLTGLVCVLLPPEAWQQGRRSALHPEGFMMTERWLATRYPDEAKARFRFASFPRSNSVFIINGEFLWALPVASFRKRWHYCSLKCKISSFAHKNTLVWVPRDTDNNSSLGVLWNNNGHNSIRLINGDPEKEGYPLIFARLLCKQTKEQLNTPAKQH